MSLSILRRLVGGVFADRRGGTAIVIAVIAAVVVAVVSLGTEVVLALDTQRRMQSAADSAALAAATAALATYPDPTQEAYAVAEAFGFTDGRGAGCNANPTVYVGAPCDGTNPTYYQVLIRAPFDLKLAKVIYSGDFTLHGQAVANISGGNACTLSLDPNKNNAFSVSGAGTNVQLQNCGAAVNSNSSSALQISGSGATLACNSGTAVYVHGGVQGTTNSCTVNSASGTFIDPYANDSIPSYNSASCVSINNVTNTKILQPGCYTGPGHSIDVKSTGILKFCPGVYVFYNANFTVASGGAAVTLQNTNAADTVSYDANLGSDCPSGGTGGAAIALTGTSQIGTVSFSSGSTVDMSGLSATSSGLPQDMLFFQDRNAASTGNDQFTGGVNQYLNGVLYFPNQTVKFAGGTGTGTGIFATVPGCTQIIARLITFTGQTNLKNDSCADQNLGATVSLSD